MKDVAAGSAVTTAPAPEEYWTPERIAEQEREEELEIAAERGIEYYSEGTGMYFWGWPYDYDSD